MEIPPYPASRPIELGDKPLLDRLCSDLQPRISELTFAGLYLFRKAHDYRLTRVAESLIIMGKGYDGIPYFLPPLGGDIPQAVATLFSDSLPLYGADDQFVAAYLARDTIQITELRDSNDYLYAREDLATLPGSRFHKKKNRINYFTSRHDYTVSFYSGTHTNGCLDLLGRWKNSTRNENDASIQYEVEATSEALQYAEELGLEGIVVIVNGSVAAFALGERLNRDTAVCHFEKADPFIEGLFQMVNREFARMLFQECRYVNREQDLGDMGLRSAKLSYHPVDIVKKYLVNSLIQ